MELVYLLLDCLPGRDGARSPVVGRAGARVPGAEPGHTVGLARGDGTAAGAVDGLTGIARLTAAEGVAEGEGRHEATYGGHMSRRAMGVVSMSVAMAAMVASAILFLPEVPEAIVAAFGVAALTPLAAVGKSYSDRLDQIDREQLVLLAMVGAPEWDENEIRSKANRAGPEVAMSPDEARRVLEKLASREYVEGKIDGSDWRNQGIGKMRPVRLYRLTEEGKKVAQVAKFWP